MKQTCTYYEIEIRKRNKIIAHTLLLKVSNYRKSLNDFINKYSVNNCKVEIKEKQVI